MKTSELIDMLRKNMDVEGDVEIHIYHPECDGLLVDEVRLDITERGLWVLC